MFKRKENLKYIKYTKKHREAYKKVEKELLGHNTWRSRVHDMDKLFLHNFCNAQNVKKIHRNTARHHDNKIKKTKNDYIDMIIDWECARYTKPDKQLNAYEVLYKYYPHLEKDILPILEEYNLAQTRTGEKIKGEQS